MAKKKASTSRKKTTRKSSLHRVSSLSTRKPKKQHKMRLPKGNQVPFRDIEKDGITYSFLSEWLQDREAARLSYVEGYTEDGVIDALEYGQMFHNCLETAAISKKPITPSDIVRRYILEKERYSKVSTSERAQIESLGNVVAVVWPLYEQYWREQGGMEHHPKTQFVAQEEAFQIPYQFERAAYVPVPLTTHFEFKTETYTMPIRGRWDAILRHGKTNRLWLMENKTKSNIDVEGLTASLTMDTQTMMYCLAIKLVYNEMPEGVLYNVIRRPQLRQTQKETHQQYLQRVQDDVLARPQHYFMRWEVSLTETDLHNWLSQIFDPLMRDVSDWWDSIKHNPFNPWGSSRHYINPEGLYGKYGRSKYFDLYTRKSTYGLRKRDK